MGRVRLENDQLESYYGVQVREDSSLSLGSKKVEAFSRVAHGRIFCDEEDKRMISSPS